MGKMRNTRQLIVALNIILVGSLLLMKLAKCLAIIFAILKNIKKGNVMSHFYLLEPICKLLTQELCGILNTGLIYSNVIKSNSKQSANYIKLIFDRNNQKYHTPKIFDATNTSQNMIRIYMLEEHKLLLDICSKAYEIDKIETFWLPNVRTKQDLFTLQQIEGATCHVVDANQDYVFAWGSWILLKLLKPKIIYQSDFRKIIEFRSIEELVDIIFNYKEKFTNL